MKWKGGVFRNSVPVPGFTAPAPSTFTVEAFTVLWSMPVLYQPVGDPVIVTSNPTSIWYGQRPALPDGMIELMPSTVIVAAGSARTTPNESAESTSAATIAR